MNENSVRESDRRKLNIIEALILASIVGMATTILMLRNTVAEQSVRTQYLAEELRTVRTQLGVFQELGPRVSRLEVQVQANKEAVSELRRMEGLR